VSVDPMLSVKAFFDIGGADSKSGAMAIWVAQFVSREIRLLDYIEGIGQPLSYYAGELRRRGWKDAVIHLPHDGVATNNVSGKRYTRANDRCASCVLVGRGKCVRQVL
jgi:phage terminase large subunit